MAAPDFRTLYRRFSSAFTATNVVELDAYVHPDLGFFVIGQPGTHVGVRRLANTEVLAMATKPDPLSSLKRVRLDCELQQGAFPTATCRPPSLYDKVGCFHSERPTLLTNRAEPFRIEYFYDLWVEQVPVTNREPPNPEDRRKAGRADALISDGVYDTSNRLGFLFGRERGRWYLLAIDTTDYCEA